MEDLSQAGEAMFARTRPLPLLGALDSSTLPQGLRACDFETPRWNSKTAIDTALLGSAGEHHLQ